MTTQNQSTSYLHGSTQFIGFLMYSLWNQGIDRVKITREMQEDDVWQLVTITYSQNLDDRSVDYRWVVRGIPLRVIDPPQIQYVEMPGEVKTIVKWGLVWHAVGIGFVVGVASSLITMWVFR